MSVVRESTVELDDDLSVIGSGAPPLRQGTTPTEYVQERERIEDADVIQALREIDGADTVTWKFERLDADDVNDNGFVGSMSNDAMTMERVAQKFGPGRYKIIGRYSNGTYAASRRVTIAQDVTVARVGRGTAGGAVAGSLGIEDWERRQEQRDERRRKERNDLLALVLPAMAPVVAALLGNRGPDVAALVTALKPPPAPTMPEMMTALASLKSLAPEQTTSPLDNALKLLDVIQDRAPSGGGETGWFDLAREVIKAAAPSIAPMIEAKLAERVQPLLAAPGNPGAGSPAPGSSIVATATSLSAVSATDVSENPAMFGLLALIPWLKTQLGMALDKAARGTDPVFIADRILDDLPDNANPQELLRFVEREDWFDQLRRLEPRVTPYREWFERMRAAMREALSDEAVPPAMQVAEVGMKESPDDEIDRPLGPPPPLT